MNEEIKEILEILKSSNEIFDILLEPKQCAMLLDYITNLQKENEKLKVNCNIGNEELKVAREYKSRCEKAIEYINENWGHWCSNHYEYATSTINILNGSDDK